MKATGIVTDAAYLQHDMGEYHPECPDRLQIIYEMIEDVRTDFNLQTIPARAATREELAANHDIRYVDHIAATAGCESTYLDPDTCTCSQSWDAAVRAVGGIFNLIDAVMDGTIRNGFALVRPPGHHAEQRRAMGFCLFNNIALAAHYALNGHGLQRVAIIDWDLHHGNGTQNSFYEDPRVLFISTHQFPHYPGSGGIREVGRGPGEGYTVNVPLPSGAGDREYVSVFHTLVAPLLDVFRPELVLISAGFDAHARDPLGGMQVTEEGYEQMLQIVMHLAADVCSDRVVLCLEGGYHLDSLRNSVERVLATLGTYEPAQHAVPDQPTIKELERTFVNRLRDVVAFQKRYWPTLPDF